MFLSRRNILLSLAGLALPFSEADRAWAKALAAPSLANQASNSLWLIRAQTKEQAVSVFRNEDGYIRSEILLMSWMMRDVTYGNQAVWMAPQLIDTLAAIQNALSSVAGMPIPLVMNSGYRTPEHNASLEGAAKNSLHKLGAAGDITAPNIPVSAVALASGLMGCGGVGIYPTFCHVDIGRPRIWAKLTNHKGQISKITPGLAIDQPPETKDQQQ